MKQYTQESDVLEEIREFPTMKTEPKESNNIQLEGQKIRLIPLNESHKHELIAAASDGKLWELWFTSVPSKENISEYINYALGEHSKGKSLPFVIINKKNNEIIGSTRFCNITVEHKRLEIGFTWYSKKHQRTGINTECKYLMLKYAFENLNCIAVEFRTNWHNQRSRIAIERIGAKQDGVLRNHQLYSDGSTRDTVVFSIIRQEWAGVKKLLEYEIKKYDK